MQGNARTVLLERNPLRVTATLPHRRPRLQSRTLVRAEAAGTAKDASKVLNGVLFTIPKRLEYGQSLCLTGEGDGLGSWSPDESLQLKWNPGDVWGVEVQLPAGQQLEYKYLVRQSDGNLATWQPGQNCAVKVPAGSDHRLQVIDDWLGKSRTVVYDDGDIGTPPTGTFDASLSMEEAQGSDDATADATASQSNATAGNEGSTGGFFAPYQPSSLQTADAPDGSDFDQAVVPEANDPAGDSPLVDDVSGTDLDALTVKDLRDRLKALGLPTSGRKSELIDRLASEL